MPLLSQHHLATTSNYGLQHHLYVDETFDADDGIECVRDGASIDEIVANQQPGSGQRHALYGHGGFQRPTGTSRVTGLYFPNPCTKKYKAENNPVKIWFTIGCLLHHAKSADAKLEEQGAAGYFSRGSRTSNAACRLSSFKDTLLDCLSRLAAVRTATWFEAMRSPVFRPYKIGGGGGRRVTCTVTDAIWAADFRCGKTVLECCLEGLKAHMSDDDAWGKFCASYCRLSRPDLNVDGITMQNLHEKATKHGVPLAMIPSGTNGEAVCAYVEASTTNTMSLVAEGRAKANNVPVGLQVLNDRKRGNGLRRNVVEGREGGESYQVMLYAGKDRTSGEPHAMAIVVDISDCPEGYGNHRQQKPYEEMDPLDKLRFWLAFGDKANEVAEFIATGPDNKRLGVVIDLSISTDRDKVGMQNSHSIVPRNSWLNRWKEVLKGEVGCMWLTEVSIRRVVLGNDGLVEKATSPWRGTAPVFTSLLSKFDK